MTAERYEETTESLKEAAQSMTIHGAPRLLQGDGRCMKLIWLIVLLGALSGLAILIVDRVKDYKKHEIYLKVKSTIMQPLPFPAVTVCNSDRFNISKVPAIPTTNISCNATENSTSVAKLSTAQRTELKIACKMFLSGYNDTIRFGGKEIPGFPQNFEYTGLFAPCFTFNTNGLASQQVNRAGMGLDMILFNDPNDVIQFNTAHISRFNDKRRGIVIQIHDPKTSASVDPDSGIAILPGYSHEIVISRKTISRKAHPFPSNCHTKKTTLYKSQQERYTTANCLLACYETKLLQKCGNGFPDNKSASQVECETTFAQEKPIRNCVCPQPCYEITYPIKMALNIWPRKEELTRMMTEFAAVLNLSQASTTGYTQSRFSKVKIYYEELINTDAMEEELYGFTSLTSEIGGVAGLFLGCSVISLVELLWLFGLSVKSLFKSIGLRQLNTLKIADNRDNVELGYANEGVDNAP